MELGKTDVNKQEARDYRRKYRPRIVIKFHDEVELPYVDGVEKYIQKHQIDSFNRLAEEFPGITLKRLFTSHETDIKELMKRATELNPTYHPKNLLTYFAIDCPSGIDPQLLSKAISKWPIVEAAYVESGLIRPPGLVKYETNPNSSHQGYLNPAPEGIDAKFGWDKGLVGADGAGIKFVDMETGWMLEHEDLKAASITLIDGKNHEEHRHGTSVLGIIVAVDNELGGVGIAPKASPHVVSYYFQEWSSSVHDAIFKASKNMKFGDVLLLEAETCLSYNEDECNKDETLWRPVETEQAVFEVIQTATKAGIVIVEPAGNGHSNLDEFVDANGRQVLNRKSTDFKDSGAIMVGAANPTDRSRYTRSNFGSRIDCYAWGDKIFTCDCDETATESRYTSSFTGTSGASAIIAGATLVIQGISQAKLGHCFSPVQLRTILRKPANGTASKNPKTDRICVMPNLRAIIQNEIEKLHIGPVEGKPYMFAELRTVFGLVLWVWVLVLGALILNPKGWPCIKCGATIDIPGYIGDWAVLLIGIGTIVIGVIGLVIEIRSHRVSGKQKMDNR